MKNKVLVKVIIPEIDKTFDMYLPINRKIGNIINLINKYASELTNNELILSNSNKLYNSITNEKYLPDVLLANTNIRNGTELVIE